MDRYLRSEYQNWFSQAGLKLSLKHCLGALPIHNEEELRGSQSLLSLTEEGEGIQSTNTAPRDTTD